MRASVLFEYQPTGSALQVSISACSLAVVPRSTLDQGTSRGPLQPQPFCGLEKKAPEVDCTAIADTVGSESGPTLKAVWKRESLREG